MAHKTLVNGASYEISGGKTLVGGTAYSISGGKTLVGGTAYEIGFGTPIGDLAVGSSVYLKRTGGSVEFLVVHQGLPSSMYDSSCNGTWLLMKNILSLQKWDRTNNDYENSDIKASLDSEYIYYNVNASIKQVKLPYNKSVAPGGTVSSGANGLSARLFLLSGYEVGWTTSTNKNFPVDGACLSYFNGASVTDAKRIGYYNGTANNWWLRSPNGVKTSCTYAWYADASGSWGAYTVTNSYGVRPAMILPSGMLVDSNFNIIP